MASWVDDGKNTTVRCRTVIVATYENLLPQVVKVVAAQSTTFQISKGLPEIRV